MADVVSWESQSEMGGGPRGVVGARPIMHASAMPKERRRVFNSVATKAPWVEEVVEGNVTNDYGNLVEQ